MCIKLNSVFLTASRNVFLFIVIFTFIAMNFAVADIASMDFDDRQGSAGGKLRPEKKIVKVWQINADFFAQNAPELRPDIVSTPGYFVAENNFQLGVPIHRDGADKKGINYLHLYGASGLPANNQFQNWSGSLNDTSEQLSSLSVSGSGEKNKLQEFYGPSSMAAADNLVYEYLSARTSSSLILVGVGLISFGFLRIRMRRLEVVKV